MSKRRSSQRQSDATSGIGDADAPGDRLGGGSPGRRPTSAAVMICNRLAQTVENVLSSDAKTSRATRLIRPLIWAWVVTVVGTVAIFALVAVSVSWSMLLALGLTAAAGGLTALVRRRRQPTIEIPGPRIPS